MNLPVRARVYIYFFGLLALAVLVYYGRDLSFPSRDQMLVIAIFLVLGFLSEVYAIRIPTYELEISGSIAICLAALFILGPSLAVFVILLTTIASELVMRWSYLREQPSRFFHVAGFNIAQLIVTVAAAGMLLSFAQHAPLALLFVGDYLWAFAAFLCYAGVNLSLVTGIVSLIEQKSFSYGLVKAFKDFFLQYISLFASALLLAVLYSVSVWHMLLGIVPLVVVHVSFRSYLRIQIEARKVFEKVSRLLDERDSYTAVHSSEVADLAVKIAKEMGLSQGEIEKTDIAARVHDIGKIAVPDSILLKRGKLNEEEWAVMKRHPLISAELIEGLDLYRPVVDAVRHEHEHWDGSGYPDGLKGEQIPLLSRIIAVADVHNALSTDRPYRKAFTYERTIEMIKEMRGTTLDPMIVDALLRVLPAVEEGTPAGADLLPQDTPRSVRVNSK